MVRAVLGDDDRSLEEWWRSFRLKVLNNFGGCVGMNERNRWYEVYCYEKIDGYEVLKGMIWPLKLSYLTRDSFLIYTLPSTPLQYYNVTYLIACDDARNSWCTIIQIPSPQRPTSSTRIISNLNHLHEQPFITALGDIHYLETSYVYLQQTRVMSEHKKK